MRARRGIALLEARTLPRGQISRLGIRTDPARTLSSVFAQFVTLGAMEAIIFTGIQASGKSTFYAERFFHTHVRINLDMLRTRHRERVLFETLLDIRASFVIDNTNITRSDRRRYIPKAKGAGCKVVGYYFETPLEDALERNARRPNGEAVPEQGVRAKYNELEPPRYGEGYDQLYTVRITAPGFGVEALPWDAP